MASDLAEPDPFQSELAWRAGALAGVVAAFFMGLAMMVTQPAVLWESIPGLYGQSGNLFVGGLAHLVHGAVYGALFALVLADPALFGVTDRGWRTLLAGVVYGSVLAIVGTGIVLPIWLGALGFPSPPSFPSSRRTPCSGTSSSGRYSGCCFRSSKIGGRRSGGIAGFCADGHWDWWIRGNWPPVVTTAITTREPLGHRRFPSAGSAPERRPLRRDQSVSGLGLWEDDLRGPVFTDSRRIIGGVALRTCDRGFYQMASMFWGLVLSRARLFRTSV